MSGFEKLGLSSEVVAAVTALGFADPLPIQAQAIPVIARGRDLIGQAQTGSGKTAAFGLPMIDHIDLTSKDIQALVLVPTRELAIQVAQAIRSFADKGDVNVIAVFGGQPIREQTEQLKRDPQIAVGTPGRVMDLIRRGWLPLHAARYVVLDEADEMLSLGFLDDVDWILRKTPAGRQTLLFSATMPPPIRRLAEKWLFEPEHVKVESLTLTVDTVQQTVIEVEQRDKLEVLIELLRRDRPAAAIVFRRRKVTVDELANQLRARGVETSALHGDMTQGQRDSVMLRFRSGRAKLLVATNVAARGLDISHVSHVISYDVPDDPEEYTHRIGRTGRVGRTGIAFTFATKREARQVAEIERVTGASIERIDAADYLRGVTPTAAPAVADDAAAPAAAVAPSAPAPVTAAENGAASPAADSVRLFVKAGRRHEVRREDLVEVFVERGGVEPLRARVHHTYSLVDVPAERADDVIERLNGAALGERTLVVERSSSQPGPGEPRPDAAPDTATESATAAA